MFFIGQSAHFKTKEIFQHLFACGVSKSSSRLRDYLAKHYHTSTDQVILYSNGRSALASALKTLFPKGNAKVAINGFTCIAVIEAVKSAHCTPVFLDINPHNLHYGTTELSSALKQHPDLKALIIQNSLGYPADISGLEQLAKNHHLHLIEDLAHCTGLVYPDGREAGTVGIATALSFGKGKSIDTISGGALVLRDKNHTFHPPVQPTTPPSFPDRFRSRWYPFFGALIRAHYHLHLHKFFTSFLLATHLISRSADAKLSLNHRLTHWQAKLALKKLSRLPTMPLREFFFIDDRNTVLTELKKQGFIFDEIWYDVPVSPARKYQSVHFPEKACPTATLISKHIVNLPTFYPDLSKARKIIENHQIQITKEDTNAKN